jgi:hypothetical protein
MCLGARKPFKLNANKWGRGPWAASPRASLQPLIREATIVSPMKSPSERNPIAGNREDEGSAVKTVLSHRHTRVLPPCCRSSPPSPAISARPQHRMSMGA